MKKQKSLGKHNVDIPSHHNIVAHDIINYKTHNSYSVLQGQTVNIKAFSEVLNTVHECDFDIYPIN